MHRTSEQEVAGLAGDLRKVMTSVTPDRKLQCVLCSCRSMAWARLTAVVRQGHLKITELPTN